MEKGLQSTTEYVLVEYEFEYASRDGSLITIKPNERYILLSRTNDNWWHVRKDENTKAFYIPAKYVKELPSKIPSVLDFHPANVDSKKDPSFDLMSDKPTDARVQLRSNLNYKKNEYRLSTFGVPMEIHDSVYKPTASESLIAIKPTSAELNTSPPCTTNTSLQAVNQKNVKIYSLEPGFLLGPKGSVDEWPSHNLKLESENPDATVYANVAELKQEASRISPTPHSTKRHLSSETQNWEVHTDQGSGQEFYYNLDTRETTWDSPFSDQEEATEDQPSTSPSPSPSPTASPSGSTEWEQHLDEASGQYYFYNPQSGETSWEPPEQEEPSLPHHMEAENQSQSRVCTTPYKKALFCWTETTRREREKQKACHQLQGSTPLCTRYPRQDKGLIYQSNTLRFKFVPASLQVGDWVKVLYDNKMFPGEVENVSDDGAQVKQPLPEEDYLTFSEKQDVEVSPNLLLENYSTVKRDRIPQVKLDADMPEGWSSEIDKDGQMCYTSNYTQEQWIKSKDEHGQIYFYKTDGSKSQWTLPQLYPRPNQPRIRNGFDPDGKMPMENWRHTMIAPVSHMGSQDQEGTDIPYCDHFAFVPHRKNWTQSWTVLHGEILTFYKDPKSQQTGTLKQSNQIVPEYTVELRGATIGWASKDKSSKKNVCELKTRNGSEYLVQYDKETIINDWHKVIMETIRKLRPDHPSEDEESVNESFDSEKSPSATDKDKEKDKKIRSTRQSFSSTHTDTDPKKVRTKLRKFLQRRPTLQSVREKGYIRDQVFGCYLDALCERENTTIPVFVEKCIQTVEQRGLDIDGIYRVSGNLAVIQKLRFKVDHEENLDLEDGLWEDIHVVTGSLKLFFRELPEPLFPFTHFKNFIAAIKIPGHNEKINYMRDLVRSLPRPNHDTMSLLFQHLRKVVEYKEVNRMSVQSVAIVFGPTLLKPESETGNIAMHMVFQNQIVECILNDYEHIFQDS
ncbi:Rho GTPase-activating protein 27 [Acipenser ruthenus]|uniref:Rho GTPase-activating protein 27 n=1 Tax=Acipenser ruthenus TaxID=7906 RepID=A0A662YPW3_ACIRT|nr:Rho GTPase-activating protein 27 [Acipenser ruthenus]